MKKDNKLQIRNSTAEFLIFTRQAGENGIEVRVADETVWLTQPLIAELFQTTVPNISMHLRGVYETGELSPEATLKKFLTVRKEGARQVKRDLEYYNLDAIIAVGFRVNSARAIQFRQWATGVLRDFAVNYCSFCNSSVRRRRSAMPRSVVATSKRRSWSGIQYVQILHIPIHRGKQSPEKRPCGPIDAVLSTLRTLQEH